MFNYDYYLFLFLENNTNLCLKAFLTKKTIFDLLIKNFLQLNFKKSSL